MKLVDILFVLTAAATVNAILIPTGNDGSPQASGTSSQVSGPTDELESGISNEYQEEPVNLSIPGRIRQHSMYQSSSNIPNQDQQQSMDEDESDNAGPNQVAVLSEKYQRTFDRMKKILAAYKKIAKKTHKDYNNYEFLGSEHQLALARGEDISESKYDPDTEIRLRQEYRKAGKRMNDAKLRLKRFMIKHGLDFEEPSSDSD
ncbi:hypothetical protein O5D80_003187 [Batrachochytrium dendrobatidis]|nr:hypothetical protein O5D80_003187 [Batrachochytrium dendrobatidis]